MSSCFSISHEKRSETEWFLISKNGFIQTKFNIETRPRWFHGSPTTTFQARNVLFSSDDSHNASVRSLHSAETKSCNIMTGDEQPRVKEEKIQLDRWQLPMQNCRLLELFFIICLI